MIKTNLEIIVKELDKALAENSELIFTNDKAQDEKADNDALKYEGKKLEAQHKKLYEMLISAKKLLKSLEY